MLNYFQGIKTAQEAKARYRDLAMKNHPDKGGDSEAMKAINNEFEIVWEKVKYTFTNKQGEEYTTSKTQEVAQDVIDRLGAIIYIPDIVIEVAGSWLWVSGNTKACKDILREAGFIYSSSKKAWYNTGEINPSKVGRPKGQFTMDQIRQKWDAEEVKTRPLNGIS